MAGEAPLIYKINGGDKQVVESGGILDIRTGGKLQNNGVDMDLSAGIATSTSSSTAELDTLHSVTAGAAAASKAVVLDANKDVTGVHKIGYTQEAEHASRLRATKSANYTVAVADSGYVHDIDTDGVVAALPPTVAGLTITFRNAGADGAVGFRVSPDAADKIQGAGFTAADDKDAINTKATAKKGDEMTIVGDGTNGWLVQRMTGTWARE